LCGAAPPASSPLARPDPPGPSAFQLLSSDRRVAGQSRTEGPDGSGVNGLTLGPLRLLGRLSPAGHGPAVEDTRLPLPLYVTATDRTFSVVRRVANAPTACVTAAANLIHVPIRNRV
jgi:hypothetical protein